MVGLETLTVGERVSCLGFGLLWRYGYPNLPFDGSLWSWWLNVLTGFSLHSPHMRLPSPATLHLAKADDAVNGTKRITLNIQTHICMIYYTQLARRQLFLCFLLQLSTEIREYHIETPASTHTKKPTAQKQQPLFYTHTYARLTPTEASRGHHGKPHPRARTP